MVFRDTNRCLLGSPSQTVLEYTVFLIHRLVDIYMIDYDILVSLIKLSYLCKMYTLFDTYIHNKVESERTSKYINEI